jgi:hypothetical protein
MTSKSKSKSSQNTLFSLGMLTYTYERQDFPLTSRYHHQPIHVPIVEAQAFHAGPVRISRREEGDSNFWSPIR